MKTTLSNRKIISGVCMMILFTLVITSCQKTDPDPSVLDDISVAAKIPTPDVPEIIDVPEGNKVIWHTYATGYQIYEVTQSALDPDVYLWTFIAPSATLYNNAIYTKEVGIHYAGPTWQATSGKKSGEFVVGLKLQASTQDVTAIPWLLLQAVPSADPNYYKQVTYIQRLYTTGGLAPTTGADADHLGEQQSVPYTAEYYFYGQK